MGLLTFLGIGRQSHGAAVVNEDRDDIADGYLRQLANGDLQAMVERNRQVEIEALQEAKLGGQQGADRLEEAAVQRLNAESLLQGVKGLRMMIIDRYIAMGIGLAAVPLLGFFGNVYTHPVWVFFLLFFVGLYVRLAPFPSRFMFVFTALIAIAASQNETAGLLLDRGGEVATPLFLVLLLFAVWPFVIALLYRVVDRVRMKRFETSQSASTSSTFFVQRRHRIRWNIFFVFIMASSFFAPWAMHEVLPWRGLAAGIGFANTGTMNVELAKRSYEVELCKRTRDWIVAGRGPLVSEALGDRVGGYIPCGKSETYGGVSQFVALLSDATKRYFPNEFPKGVALLGYRTVNPAPNFQDMYAIPGLSFIAFRYGFAAGAPRTPEYKSERFEPLWLEVERGTSTCSSPLGCQGSYAPKFDANGHLIAKPVFASPK